MKRCPECRRDYYDDTLHYCLDDGAALLEGPASDEPATAILSEPGAAATGFPREEVSGEEPKNIAFKRNSIIAAVVVIAVVTAFGIGGYIYYGRGTTKQIDSIAVMPFTNESGNAEIDYLSDGMTETLINTLTQLPNLKVKPRSSAFRYRGRESDAKTIGSELNVRAIVNGRLVQRGDEITLFLSLIDTGTENQIWGRQYTRKVANLVTLQAEIVRDVSESLKAKLSGADEQKLTKNYTENAEAYQLYLKGRFAWNKRTEKDMQRATEFFQQAIALDPDYALAYAGLADTYAAVAMITDPDPLLRRERVAKGREAALKALSIDNNLPEAHTALGTILGTFDYDATGAEREYRRAIEFNPDNADSRYWYALHLTSLGRFDEALSEFKRVLELEPLNLTYQAAYGGVLAHAGRPEEAIAHLQKIHELDENFRPTLGNLAIAYQLKGDYARVVELRTRELELSGDGQSATLGRDAFAKGGWEGYLRYQTSDRRPRYQSVYTLAVYHTGLGEKEKALAALNKSYENREGILRRMKVDPRLDPLRDDPRFQELLRKIGFPE